jgi:RND family efflux transporter MFP subunit
MKSMRQPKWIASVATAVAMAGFASFAAAEPFMPNGLTKPTQRVEIAVPVQGLVKDVPVKPGDTVKKGQLLVQLDDTVERQKADSLEIDAKSDVQIKAADAELAQKRKELERKMGPGFSVSEQEEAKLAVDVGELRVQLAQQDKIKKTADLQVQQTLITKMKIVSPIDGVVEKIDADPGEVWDPSKPAIVVVDNSKIDVEVSLKTDLVNKLKIGDMVDVRYEDDSQPRQAKIIYLSPVADAASDTRQLRATMANSDNRPSGMSISVKPPESKSTAAAVQP